MIANFESEKDNFQINISKFAKALNDKISLSGEWNIKGFIDIFKNIYSISSDYKYGENIFDDYWINYGKIQIETKEGKRKPISSIKEYIFYRGI